MASASRSSTTCPSVEVPTPGGVAGLRQETDRVDGASIGAVETEKVPRLTEPEPGMQLRGAARVAIRRAVTRHRVVFGQHVAPGHGDQPPCVVWVQPMRVGAPHRLPEIRHGVIGQRGGLALEGHHHRLADRQRTKHIQEPGRFIGALVDGESLCIRVADDTPVRRHHLVDHHHVGRDGHEQQPAHRRGAETHDRHNDHDPATRRSMQRHHERDADRARGRQSTLSGISSSSLTTTETSVTSGCSARAVENATRSTSRLGCT